MLAARYPLQYSDALCGATHMSHFASNCACAYTTVLAAALAAAAVSNSYYRHNRHHRSCFERSVTAVFVLLSLSKLQLLHCILLLTLTDDARLVNAICCVATYCYVLLYSVESLTTLVIAACMGHRCTVVLLSHYGRKKEGAPNISCAIVTSREVLLCPLVC
eukprot:6302-Heterococcus_DN1.PRE.4